MLSDPGVGCVVDRVESLEEGLVEDEAQPQIIVLPVLMSITIK